MVGSEQPVLWEQVTGADDDGLRWVGYTDNYVRVQGVGPAGLANRITPARIQSANAAGVIGQVILPLAAD